VNIESFLPAIEKTIISCKASSQNIKNDFAQSVGIVDIDSKAQRKVSDYRLSSYAC